MTSLPPTMPIVSGLEAARRLAVEAEQRDTLSQGHLSRVSKYCALLGRAAGLDEATIGRLSLAAPLHDIGKIALPEAILLKPGPLTIAERRTMQEHTTLGAHILRGSRRPEMRMAETIALTHHERWDGTGYPFGLRGGQIPIEGRICAIGDVFDALTSVRPYKDAWTMSDALSEMWRQAGRQFDEGLVALFTSDPGAIKAIHDHRRR